MPPGEKLQLSFAIDPPQHDFDGNAVVVSHIGAFPGHLNPTA
jgi:hypothetical protein